MGIFSSIKKAFVGGGNTAHFFADEKTQRATTDAVAREVATYFQSPAIKLRDDGGEIHVTGTYRGRSARVTLDITFGGVTAEIKALAQDQTFFMLTHDQTSAETYAASRVNRDQWDKEDDVFGELRVYVSKHVRYEGDGDEINERRAFWDALPADLRDVIVAACDESNGTFLVSSGTISMKPWQGLLGRGDAAAVIRSHLDIATRAAEVIEAGLVRLR